ncbi:hypothetical protein B0I35DRAFT_395816 [Stachybotrys elegans]|uniref:T6SS Phospholipase effector Tle1-like catalytic domain-containing protein n=1 Tax=Stachybotrys elegans TaxID=80388 RepID=A0A8K0SFU1_9HYPO|nr:hypothetical protein B0I35DRAFT_395816 [Stachybotrys elegans]
MASDLNGSSGKKEKKKEKKEPHKLILCFDGTGNSFSGSNADTNVVKILNKLDRHHPKQYFYYQTGVGTYDINEKSVHKTWLGEIRSSMSKTIDQAIGTTFDAHVMAGYRFLMRYHKPGDKIYMFGFSRGAFTAKFLARMIHTVGLLCKGNEELVPFAYRLYQRYLDGELEDFRNEVPSTAEGDEELLEDTHRHGGTTSEQAKNEITAFSNTFCRKELIDTADKKDVETNVKVYFLGIWDCVNSVAVFEGTSPLPVPVKGTAHHIRHAVSVDERRVKFKPALLAQDIRSLEGQEEDIKEVWFPGCHGDVGGGWPAGDNDNVEDSQQKSWWTRFKDFWVTSKPKGATSNISNDAFQLSDVALSWMIRELELVGMRDEEAAVKWSDKNLNGYKRAFCEIKSQKQALKGNIHDSLNFGCGTGFFTVLLWKFLEVFPFLTRWELVGDEWVKVRFPLNRGSFRDIPRDAVLHESVVTRLLNVPTYHPCNNHGGDLEPCLKHNGVVPKFEILKEMSAEGGPGHHVYTFPRSMRTD